MPAAAAAASTSSADAATGGAKLYFRHGTVSSAKTLALLAVAHTYEVQGKRVLVLKPSIDTRWGAEAVASRAGLSRNADHLIDPEATELPTTSFDGISCILVDEAQVGRAQYYYTFTATALDRGHTSPIFALCSLYLSSTPTTHQFLSPHVVGLLREVATIKKVPVICYGLRTDFRSKLFDGSKRLLELADCIEEIKVVASFFLL